MKITSKGQVTVPLPIRSEFGFKPGTDVEFVAEAGKVILRAKRDALSGLPKMWRKRQQIQKTRGVSISEIWRQLDKRIFPAEVGRKPL